MSRLLMLICIIVSIACNFSVGECREFVFLLDTSSSMNNSDPMHRAPECINWMTANLSEEDEVGIIYFNDNPVILRPLTTLKKQQPFSFDIDYSGRSNTGDALLAAIDMLTPNPNTERNIIMVTDGEIALDTPELTLQSIEKFQNGVRQAEWANIPIYILNLRYQGDQSNYHLYTGYAKDIPVPQWELMTSARTLMHNDFHTPHIELPTNGVLKGNISIDIPIHSANRVRFILTSSNPGTAMLKSKSSSIITGKYVKVFDVTLPDSTHFDFNVDYPEGTGLTLDMIAETTGEINADISSSLFGEDKLEITPVHIGDRNADIFADNYFNGKKVLLRINGNDVEATVNNGTIETKLDNTKDNIELQKINFEDLGVRFIGESGTQMDISKNNYLSWLFALIGIAIIITLLYLLYRKRKFNEEQQNLPPPPPPVINSNPSNTNISTENKPKVKPKEHVIKLNKQNDDEIEPVQISKPSKVSYNGKLLIYVTKTPDDEDIPPQEFNLFRLFNAKPISLADILSGCSIELDFIGAEDIVIGPMPRGIFIKNASDCTITKRHDILLKGSRTDLYYGDSIYVTSSDEEIEITLIYKSLKPS